MIFGTKEKAPAEAGALVFDAGLSAEYFTYCLLRAALSISS